jgi:multidrug efflux pump subunit AcrB
LLFLSIFAVMVRQPKVDFFPSGEPNFVYVYNELPVGTDASVTDSVTRTIEERVYKVIGRDNPIVKSVITNIGLGAGDPQNPAEAALLAPHKSKVTVAFENFEDRLKAGQSSAELLQKIRASVGSIPGATIVVDQEQNGPPTGKPIQVEIVGPEFDTLINVEKQVRQAIARSGIEGIEKLRSDLVLNKPEIIVDIDREKAGREGISTAQIAGDLRTALFGTEVSTYRTSEDEYDIIVRLQEPYRNSVEQLLSLNISYLDMATGGFRQIPLSSVATVRYASTFTTINRKNQERTVTLSSNVLNGYNANEIVAQLTPLFADLKLPDGYGVRMGGEQEDQKETSDFLGTAFLGALMLMFIVLVAQFNSVSKPLIIFFTVLLSLIGVLLGFAIFNMTISIVMTGVGIFALAGIVVKNGIILLEFTEELRDRGYSAREAVIEAGATRLTPVLLTALAAILGLIPLGIGLNINFVTLFTHLDPEFFVGGDSSVLWGPLAWTVIFGLAFATILTLVIVPSMYWIVEGIKQRFNLRKRDEPVAEQAAVPAE